MTESTATSQLSVISKELDSFSVINLLELDKVSLLDRVDTKFTFKRDQLPEILEKLKNDYFVLEIDNHRMFNYNSLYFDTDNFHLFNLHSTGRMNRYKIRYRKYVETGLSFFEVKFKNNKGRTIKSRVSMKSDDMKEENSVSLLKEKTPFTFDQLNPKIWINYVRITLVSKTYSERVTIDLNLTFKNESESKLIEGLAIAELKQNKVGVSAFGKLMKEMHIKSGSISKYCFGVVTLFNTIRKNNFKEQVLQINKLVYAAPTRY